MSGQAAGGTASRAGAAGGGRASAPGHNLPLSAMQRADRYIVEDDLWSIVAGGWALDHQAEAKAHAERGGQTPAAYLLAVVFQAFVDLELMPVRRTRKGGVRGGPVLQARGEFVADLVGCSRATVYRAVGRTECVRRYRQLKPLASLNGQATWTEEWINPTFGTPQTRTHERVDTRGTFVGLPIRLARAFPVTRPSSRRSRRRGAAAGRRGALLDLLGRLRGPPDKPRHSPAGKIRRRLNAAEAERWAITTENRKRSRALKDETPEDVPPAVPHPGGPTGGTTWLPRPGADPPTAEGVRYADGMTRPLGSHELTGAADGRGSVGQVGEGAGPAQWPPARPGASGGRPVPTFRELVELTPEQLAEKYRPRGAG